MLIAMGSLTTKGGGGCVMALITIYIVDGLTSAYANAVSTTGNIK
jgi:hypothetical protein